MINVNLNVLNIIKGINESKHVGNVTPYKWNNEKCQVDCKKPIRHCLCEEDYPWNHGTCACDFDNYCEIGEYLQDCEYMKSPVNDLVVTCDEIWLHQGTVSINLSDKINY